MENIPQQSSERQPNKEGVKILQRAIARVGIKPAHQALDQLAPGKVSEETAPKEEIFFKFTVELDDGPVSVEIPVSESQWKSHLSEFKFIFSEKDAKDLTVHDMKILNESYRDLINLGFDVEDQMMKKQSDKSTPKDEAHEIDRKLVALRGVLSDFVINQNEIRSILATDHSGTKARWSARASIVG